ncbi:hypothetical protein PAMP_007821 [Pampus punctatissimus]
MAAATGSVLCTLRRAMIPSLVVILGATGTGKSKLAIELGKRLQGEIISADSMQVYQGLDIITNKVTAEECAQCRHHMISFVDPLVSSYTVCVLGERCPSMLNDRLIRNKLPIIVGGTNYYIESLLWRVLIDTAENNGPKDGGDGAQNRKLELEKLGGAELHKRLMKVDPKMAAMLHPNDKRKIARSLQIHEETGVPHSHWLEEQKGLEGSDELGGPLRYPNPCIFWLHTDKDGKERELKSRMEEMPYDGVITLIRSFHQRTIYIDIKSESQDYQHGIFQSIGFKEFHDYLTAPESSTQQEKDMLRDKGIEALKTATRRYARKQNKWVRNRFLKRPGHNVPAVYGLNVTDLSKWEETVLNPALQILDSLSKGEEPAVAPIRVQEAERGNKRVYHTCNLCDKVIIGDLDWTAHLNSKKHHHHVRKKRKLDSACERSQSPAAAPVSAAETVESLSKDACAAAVASGCSETAQESSQEDSKTAHKNVPVTF